MLRITEKGINGNVVLKLEGRIVGPWVTELERAATRILDKGCNLQLDLADVSYVDRAGVMLMKEFKRRGIVLEGCSPFVAEELREAEGLVLDSKRQAPPTGGPAVGRRKGLNKGSARGATHLLQ